MILQSWFLCDALSPISQVEPFMIMSSHLDLGYLDTLPLVHAFHGMAIGGAVRNKG